MFLTGCATTPPPHNKENVCSIFQEYPHWYKAAKKTQCKWGVPVNVQMAIIYYESAFQGDAKPRRKYYLGFIPGKHISSAYGYAQALNGTWDEYLAYTGKMFARRTQFESATDFIGWYSALARQQAGIDPYDPYSLYLAYHEGIGGYQRKSYIKKPWLMRLAKNVALKSQLFELQLAEFERPTQFNIPIERLPKQDAADGMPELEPPATYYVCKSENSSYAKDSYSY